MDERDDLVPDDLGLHETVSADSAPREDPAAAPRVLLGRYYTLERLGAGGAGTVYAVYDRVLDRRVALKLMHARGEDRLLREAQAMARLKHPNVVTVYDVGLVALSGGDHGFVTMELVDGVSARAWLAAERRAPRQVLEVYLQAGRGLAAAHQVGLIHRDFKPDNVLVDRSGAVRVADFGLARLAGDAPPAALDGDLSPGLTGALTHTGAVMGTPHYMAPEQARGEPADARSDQYGFCVSLWEALAGELPPRAAAELPSWIRAALARGLAPDPAARFVSMAELLDRLARDPARTRRRALATVAVAGLAVAGAVGLIARPPEAAVCSAVDEPVHEAWSPGRRETVRQAVLATGVAYALPLADWTVERLDAYAVGLGAQLRSSCEATEVRHVQTPTVGARRARCLADRLTELTAAAGVLSGIDARSVDRAPSIVGGLGQLQACASAGGLLDELPPPEEREAAARVAALKIDIAGAEAKMRAGQEQPAIASFEQLRERVRAASHAPLTARTLYALGSTRLSVGDHKLADAELFESYLAAIAGRSDLFAARAAVDLAQLNGRTLQRWDDADRWATLARVHLARGGGDVELEGNLEHMLARNAFTRGRFDEAEGHARKAEELLTRANVPPSRKALVARELGSIYYERGDDARALEAFGRALAGAREVYGDAHPLVAIIMASTAQVHQAKGDTTRALELLEGAVATAEKVYPPTHAQLGALRRGLADSYVHARRLGDARREYTRAREIVEASMGPRHRMNFPIRSGLARVRGEEGDLAGAIADLQELIRFEEEVEGVDHFLHHNDYDHLRLFATKAGRHDVALHAARRQVELARKAHGDDHALVASGLVEIEKIEKTQATMKLARARKR